MGTVIATAPLLWGYRMTQEVSCADTFATQELRLVRDHLECVFLELFSQDTLGLLS